MILSQQGQRKLNGTGGRGSGPLAIWPRASLKFAVDMLLWLAWLLAEGLLGVRPLALKLLLALKHLLLLLRLGKGNVVEKATW